MPDFSSPAKIRDWIASIGAVRCRMAHEAVVFEGGVAKRRSQGVGLEPVLVRAGLCDFQDRIAQLSCAHTTARNQLERAIDALAGFAVLEADQAHQLKTALRHAGNDIHQMDMEKSQFEQRYALMREKAKGEAANPFAHVSPIRYGLKQLGVRHDSAVDRLNDIRHVLLKLLDG